MQLSQFEQMRLHFGITANIIGLYFFNNELLTYVQ